MKKITAMLTALTMLSCCLVSCGNDDGDDERSSRKNSSSSSQSEERTEPEETEPAHHKALRKFIEALNDYNVESCMKFLMPQIVIDLYGEEMYDEFYDVVEEIVNDFNDEIRGECGDDAVTTLGEIISEQKLSDEMLKLSKYYFMDLGVPEDEELTIKEGYEITFTAEAVGKNGTDSDEATFCLIKIENDGWKLFLDAAEYLEYYDPDYDPFADFTTTTAAVTTSAAVTTATAAETQPATSAQLDIPHVSVSPDYKMSSFPTLDFMSFAMGLNPIFIGGEDVYSYEISILPSQLYDKIADSGQLKKYNKETAPCALGVRNYVLQGNSDAFISVDDVSDMQLLTDEELNKVSEYYYDVMSRYGITDLPLTLIGGYSADVCLKSDAEGSSAAPVRMICVTTDHSDSSVLPCGIDELDKLLP